MNKIKVIKQTELLGKQLTVYGTPEEPLFLAKEVAEILNSDVLDIIKKVGRDELLFGENGCQDKVHFITEDGIYYIVESSNHVNTTVNKKALDAIVQTIRLEAGSKTRRFSMTDDEICEYAYEIVRKRIEKKIKSKCSAEEFSLETAMKLENSGFVPYFFYSYADSYGKASYKYTVGGEFIIRKTFPYDEMIRLSKTLSAFFTGNVVIIDDPDEFERMRMYLTNSTSYYADDKYMDKLKRLYQKRSSDFRKVCSNCSDDMFDVIINLHTRKVAQLKGSNKSIYIVNIINQDEFIQSILDTLGFDNKYINHIQQYLWWCLLINTDARWIQSSLFGAFKEFSLKKPVVYTYIIKGANGQYKIGRSCDIYKRYKSLLTANPDIKIEFIINKDVEYSLHNEYSHKRISGEWFMLSKNDLKSIKMKYSEFIKK